MLRVATAAAWFLLPSIAAAQTPTPLSGPISGPSSSTIGNVPIFSNTTGSEVIDSGKSLPVGAVVGTTDTQTLNNKTITYTAPGTGATSSSVYGKLSQIINAADFGLVDDPTCATDATTPLKAAIAAAAAGKKLVLPAGKFCLNTPLSTLKITSSMEIEGQGTGNTLLFWNAPVGATYAPTIDVLASNVTIHDLAFDGNAVGRNYLDSIYYGGTDTSPMAAWGEVAFVIEGDNFTGYNLKGRNAFSNCIGIGKVTPDGLAPTPGSPRNVTLNNIYTEFCGNGLAASNQLIPGHSGFGIDNGSGSYVNISNVVDSQSFNNFGNDLNAGATVNWTNAWGYFARHDPSHTGSIPATGFGFYNGSAGGTFNNINIISPSTYGIWADASSSQTAWNNITVRGARRECLIIGATSSNWNNVNCQNPSVSQPGGFAGVRIRNDQASCVNGVCTPLPISNLSMNNLVIEGLTSSLGDQNAAPTWSYAIETTGGANNITGVINMNAAKGAKAPGPFKLDSSVTGLQINHKEANTHAFDDPSINSASAFRFAFGGLTNIKSKTPNSSWKTSPFGDYTNNGTLFLSDTAVPTKRLAMGWDPVNDVSVIQSMSAGVVPMPLALNPSSGSVYLGQPSLSTTSFIGFPYIGTVTGNPTGTPTNVPGMAPLTFDDANKNLDIFSGIWLKIPATTASGTDVLGVNANRLVQPSSIAAADTPVLLVDATIVTLNFSTGKNYSLPLTLPSTTLGNPTNVSPGRTGFVRVSQDATGNRSLLFDTAYKFAGGMKCVVSQTPNSVTYVRWTAFSTTELATTCELDVK